MTDHPGAPDYDVDTDARYALLADGHDPDDPQLRRAHADVAALLRRHRHLTTGDGPLAAWRDTTPLRRTHH